MSTRTATKTVTLSKDAIREKDGVVVLPLKKWKEIEKENMELHSAIEAVLDGESARQKKQTRTFRAFLKSEFPQYAQNI